MKMKDLPCVDVSKLKEGIYEALEPHGEVVVAYLYGSRVKGYSREDSDVDVGLLLDESFEPGPLYPERLAGEIEEKIQGGCVLDVRVLNNRAPGFQYRVIREGVIILCRDELKRAIFESAAASRYLDMKPFHDVYDMYRARRLMS